MKIARFFKESLSETVLKLSYFLHYFCTSYFLDFLIKSFLILGIRTCALKEIVKGCRFIF